jgi:transcriptional regulator with XRE-family HTH domain
MPSNLASTPSAVLAQLQALGQALRAQRKRLQVSAVATAEAAGMSRVTLHRIEKGEPSVTIGAYLSALTALGMAWHVDDPTAKPPPTPRHAGPGTIPVRILLSDYPQLKQLAWQVHGTDALTPVEALNIYERNARHMDEASLPPHERDLLAALRQALGNEHHV